MRRIPKWIAIAAVSALLGAGGCGTDQPPVCDSLAAVQATMNQVRNANVAENGLTYLETNLQQLKLDLRQLATDATAQFAPEVEVVRAAANQFSASLDTARADLDVTALAGVRATLGTLQNSVRNLGDAMSGTC
ncbi:hypothetical protein AB0368_29275 [Actinoplanes sp. NPDC051475]|uniref:hypothetical protein n=1 Tax=Actinoplanes sp. NPDC051475 TaxID=3157225 RepID=UPI00344DD78B